MENETAIPAPGTYRIGFEPLNSEVFVASYIHIVDGEYHNATEYDTMDGSGTLTIESSNEETIKGRFEFTAHSRNDDFEIDGTSQVVGDFKANRRIPL